jgi:chaperonin GroES
MKTLVVLYICLQSAPVSNAFVVSPISLTHRTSSLPMARLTLDGVELPETATSVQPTGNAVWVQVRDTLVATSGGILLPDQAQERPTEGTVVAVGPGKRHPHTGILIQNPVSVGQSVLYGQFEGKQVEYNGRDCQVVRDDNILLTYEGVTLRLDSIQPVRDYVLVELAQEQLTTESGVVVANQVMKDYAQCQGRVVKIGEGRLAGDGKLTKSPVQVGDFCKFKDYAGNEIDIEGKLYSIVKMVDILCTLDEDAKESDGEDNETVSE